MKNIDNRYVKERKDSVYKYKQQPNAFIRQKIPKEYILNKTSGIIRIFTRQRKRERKNKQNLN